MNFRFTKVRGCAPFFLQHLRNDRVARACIVSEETVAVVVYGKNDPNVTCLGMTGLFGQSCRFGRVFEYINESTLGISHREPRTYESCISGE